MTRAPTQTLISKPYLQNQICLLSYLAILRVTRTMNAGNTTNEFIDKNMSIDKDHTIKNLEQNDYDWIVLYLKKLRAYLEDKSGQKLLDIPEPKFLDKYFPTALADLESGQLNEGELINMFGTGFGQYLEEKAGFHWVIFTDKYGTDLAVQNKTTKVIGFPLSSTAKRLNDETAGHFDTIFETLTNGKAKPSCIRRSYWPTQGCVSPHYLR